MEAVGLAVAVMIEVAGIVEPGAKTFKDDPKVSEERQYLVSVQALDDLSALSPTAHESLLGRRHALSVYAPPVS